VIDAVLTFLATAAAVYSKRCPHCTATVLPDPVA
jgi:hypothetical protein